MGKTVKTWATPVRNEIKEKVTCVLCGGEEFTASLKCEGFGFVRCKSCGLVQMNPQPVHEEIAARYRTAHGNDYLKYEIENEDSFLKLQLLALKDIGFLKKRGAPSGVTGTSLSPAKAPGAFLDIGCATGTLLAYLRDHGWNVTGVEISPSAVYAAKQRNLDVRNIPLEECGFAPDSFDVVHASHLIEHLKNPRSFLKEVHRVLKPDGCVYISTPNIAGFQAVLFGSRWRSAIFDHLYLFSKRTLKKLLEDTGFKIKHIRTWGGLAAGTSPKRLKKIADFSAKLFNAGDVMIIKAVK